ncbi:SCO family protein [Brevundimonas sp.]|uniref:SCO family protein n=1 Tax=Brevundimonas sp. TaxID=1871086 RepID=UPI0026210A3A|nr:SCO family protein [Brevundimonas sp.]
MPRRTVILFAAAVCGMALALALITVMVVGARDRAGTAGAGAAGTSYVAASEDQPRVGGPFTLTDQNGRPVTEAMLEGRWSLVFFGFTFCPDYCPTTLAMLEATRRELGDQGKDLQFVFITVDPGRDGPAEMKAYLDSEGFPPGVVGLTGTPEQIAAAAKAYAVVYEKVGEGEAYTMNHSLAIWLMGPDGRSRASLNHQQGPEAAARMIRTVRARG